MTSNLLTLNTSKTEFLLIGLKQQLAKIQNYTLNTTHSARNLLSLINISLSLIKYLHFPNPAILTFVNLAVSAPILISKQPIPSHRYTSIVHSKLDCCNSLYYNLPYSAVKQASTNPELSCSCCF